MDTQPLPPVPPPPRKRRIGLIVGVVAGVLVLFACLCGIGSAIAMRGKDDTADKKPAAVAPAESLPPSKSASPSASPTVGGPTAVVPNLVGQRLSAAQATLAAAGFEKVSARDATGERRVVINSNNWLVRTQSPAAGTRLAKSATVTLNVSKPTDGPEPGPIADGVVPAVVCKDLQTAQDTLQAAGFRDLASEDGTGQARQQIIDRNWLVIAQSASAGSRPPATTRIVLKVVKYGEPTGGSGCKS
jgi:hypothetical protein